MIGDFGDDLFGLFGFPFGRNSRNPNQKRKGKDFVKTLPVTLEELYIGKQVKFQYQRTALCSGCEG